MDILKDIIANKLIEVEQAKKKIALKDLIRKIRIAPQPRNFKKAISKSGKLCIIAEIKKASPSAGIIRKDFNPLILAESLKASGADALSVLTDRKFFKGDLSYIRKIKAKVSLPVLRKDFIIDEYQIYESRANGADAVLLIARILSGAKLESLYILAKRLKMSCLVEVCSKAELKKVLKVRPDILGINNRNLKNLKIDFKASKRLKPLIPKGVIAVSESGIQSIGEINLVKRLQFNAVLIGESLMRRPGVLKIFKFG